MNSKRQLVRKQAAWDLKHGANCRAIELGK